MSEPVLPRAAGLSIRTVCRGVAAHRLDLTVEGAAHLPPKGPLLLAARHYHHLYDACALLTAVERPLYFFVALDWVHGRPLRGLMEWACHTARWPVVLRRERLRAPAPRVAAGTGVCEGSARPDAGGASSAFAAGELTRYLRRGLADGVRLLCEGQALVVFPEGYPNVDPTYTPKQGDQFLPFRGGFVRLVARAERALGAPVPVMPVGLSYARGPRWQVVVRFGAPLHRADWPCGQGFVQAVEAQCRARAGGTVGEPDAPRFAASRSPRVLGEDASCPGRCRWESP